MSSGKVKLSLSDKFPEIKPNCQTPQEWLVVVGRSTNTKVSHSLVADRVESENVIDQVSEEC